MRRFVVAAVALMSGAPAWPAPEPGPSDLPAPAEVAAVLRELPAVRAARAAVGVGRAARERLRSGPHELSIRADGARRRASDAGPAVQNLAEWSVGIERPLRLPGKADLDGRLGELGVTSAELAYGDALHEAGRDLLVRWYAWRREAAQARQWDNQVAELRLQVDAVERRLKAGDASRVEKGLAEAELARAEAARNLSQARAQAAGEDLRLRFPGLALAMPPEPGPPEQIDRDLAFWREQTLQHSHEMALASAESRTAQLAAQRARAERRPDPTVGIRYSSELGGAERVLGIFVSIPIPGGARSADDSGARAKAEVALERENAVRRKIEAEVAAGYAEARAAWLGWQSLAGASERIRVIAGQTARAYELGELGLLDVLTARRQAHEAALAERLAMLEAAQGRYRLMLDAHRLWALDADEDPGAAAAVNP